MPLSKASNFGDPHIGLFARASDKLVVADPSVSPKFLLALKSFNLPILPASFGGSGLAGIFLAINSSGVLLPPFCGKDETAVFRRHGLNTMAMPGQFSAAGNNVAANDFGAMANPEIPRQTARKISDCLGVEVVQARVAGYPTVGSCIVATNRGFAAHNRAGGQELKELQSLFHVAGQNCTVNTGLPFVSLGLVANSAVALAGEACTGFEAGRAASALGLV